MKIFKSWNLTTLYSLVQLSMEDIDNSIIVLTNNYYFFVQIKTLTFDIERKNKQKNSNSK